MKSFQPLKRILFSVLLTLAVLAASLPQPALAAPLAATTCVTYHTVKSTDTAPRIAHTYGLKWREIAKANDLEYPYKLEEGQRLCIPPEGTSTSTTTTSYTITGKTKVSVTIVGRRVFVTASDFAVRSTFQVKVREATASIGGWHKIGPLRLNKNTTLTSVYTLPDELRSTPLISVCLKNMTTDELICRNAPHL